MARKKIFVSKATEDRLKILGEQIKYARLRRKLSVTVVAERSGLSRPTIYAVENGDPSTAIAAYAGVMMAIGMPDEITLPLREDPLGRLIQDTDLHISRRNS